MLSTYPPTACGLATFSSALERALIALGHRVSMVRVDDGALESTAGRAVAGTLVNGSAHSVSKAAAVLSNADVAIIQHEYGIFGGRDGEEVLDVIRAVRAPVMVVLHTVPTRPSANQARILVEICAQASSVVVLTDCARDRLLSRYPVGAARVATIRHGALLPNADGSGRLTLHRPPGQLLSWGLLGPGKGVENVIDAVGTLNSDGHPVTYTVAGMIHPKVALRSGESYRLSLIERARRSGVAHLVDFDRAYRSPAMLTQFIASSSVVVMSYESVDQAVSGVLVDSIAAGRPVIATAFPHAVELLADGAGIVVAHGDQTALTEAIRAVTQDATLLESMAERARALAPAHSWSAVAECYVDEMSELLLERRSVSA